MSDLEALPIFDAERLPIELEVYDQDLVRSLYEDFLGELEKLNAFLLNQQLIKANAAEQMATHCHRLKSSSIVIGAYRLSLQLLRIELISKRGEMPAREDIDDTFLLISKTAKAVEAAKAGLTD